LKWTDFDKPQAIRPKTKYLAQIGLARSAIFHEPSTYSNNNNWLDPLMFLSLFDPSKPDWTQFIE
jgi:hypothetical protein